MDRALTRRRVGGPTVCSRCSTTRRSSAPQLGRSAASEWASSHRRTSSSAAGAGSARRCASPGQRRRRDLGARGDELRRRRVVGLRLPRRGRGTAAPPGDLQQRRQRRRAVRPRAALRRRGVATFIGLGDRRHRAGRRGHRGRSSGPGRGRDGRRARPRPDPDGRPARAGPAGAAVQLRVRSPTSRASRR